LQAASVINNCPFKYTICSQKPSRMIGPNYG
jgi:hypothetical protein